MVWIVWSLGDFGSRAAGGAGEAKAQRVIGRVGRKQGPLLRRWFEEGMNESQQTLDGDGDGDGDGGEMTRSLVTESESEALQFEDGKQAHGPCKE